MNEKIFYSIDDLLKNDESELQIIFSPRGTGRRKAILKRLLTKIDLSFDDMKTIMGSLYFKREFLSIELEKDRPEKLPPEACEMYSKERDEVSNLINKLEGIYNYLWRKNQLKRLMK